MVHRPIPGKWTMHDHGPATGAYLPMCHCGPCHMNSDTPEPLCGQDNNAMRTREEEVEKYEDAAMGAVWMARSPGAWRSVYAAVSKQFPNTNRTQSFIH
jgi:hypothetical protein